MSLYADIRNSLHLARIGFVLARHGALFPLEEMQLSPFLLLPLKVISFHRSALSRGKRLTKGLEALGPTFIKLGQMLSTRADLVGEDIAEDLASLRDKLPPFPTVKATAVIERELRQPVATLFSSFEEQPVAAASIAQVHFAILPDATPVAVKVLRPNIEEAFARDIELFYWLAEWVEENVPAAQRLRPREVVQVFENMVRFELDLRLEAASAAELKENAETGDYIHVPAVYWNHTSHSVLTLERVSGITISDVASLKAAGHDLDALMEHLAAGFFNQAFRDGFFHADLHPGNIFVQGDGCIAVVDFGIMGRLGKRDRIFVAEIFRGFLNEDFMHVAQVHVDAGYVPRDTSVEQFALACRAIAKPILNKPLNEVSIGMLLGQLFKVTEAFSMETQPQLLLFQKTMVMVEGIGRMLNPNVNMWKMAQPLIERWGKENLGLAMRLQEHMEEAIKDLRSLPHTAREAQKLIHRLNEEGIPLSSESIDKLARQRTRMQRPWVVLSWTLFLGAILLVLWRG